jgi:CheY-like chemotaxis protein
MLRRDQHASISVTNSHVNQAARDMSSEAWMTSSGEDALGALMLPPVLDLAAAEWLLETLRQRCEAGESLQLEASQVEVLTLPCMQIIVAAAHANTRMAVVRPSDAFVAAFEDVALTFPRVVSEQQEESAVRLSEQEAPTTTQQVSPEIASNPIDASSADAQAQPWTAVMTPDPPENLPSESIEETVSPHILDETVTTSANDRIEAGSETLHEDETAASAMEQKSILHEENVEDEFIDNDQTDEANMPKRILTIDDSKTMRDMLRVTLTDAGFDVLQGIDGQNGLDVLGQQRVDAVITDINMPIMDGYEVIRQLRRSPMHKTTPILVLTTESDAEKKKLARDAGATGWMVKPFDPERLIATVRKVAP